MEERKQKEIEFFDRETEQWLKSRPPELADFEFLLASYKFLYNLLRNKCQAKKILDYGCGNGIHSIWLAEYGGNVTGIDLSRKSLEIVRKRAKEKGFEDKIKFLVMDCEKMTFPNDSFDIIFDGGTFSSLDLIKALPELARVLKPNGFLIGIETLGHNPFTNIKRKINKLTGKRTEWAAEHIFKMKDLKEVARYFGKIEIYFFHLISWLAFPFLNLPGGKILLKLLEKIDNFLLFIFPFLKRYSFKIVFILSEPKK